MIKITKLKDLGSKQNVFQLHNFESYSTTSQFQNILQVINEYFYKFYNAFQTKQKDFFMSCSNEFQEDPTFSKVYNKNFQENNSFYMVLQKYLRYCIHSINRNIKNQEKSQDLSQDSLVLLDYSVTWFQIVQIILDKEQDYEFFTENSQIDSIAEGKPVKLNSNHYNQIRNKIYSLEI